MATGPWQGKEAGPVAPVQGSFSFLCLHAAVALTPLLPSAHSLLLTSGTLSPMEPLVAELGLGAKPGAKPGASPPSEHKPSAESDTKPNLAPLSSTMSGDIPLWARSHDKPAIATAGQACPDSASQQGVLGHTTQVKHGSAASATAANDHSLPSASYDPTPASPPIALPIAAAALNIASEVKHESASWPRAEALSEDGQAHAVSASPSTSPPALLEGGTRQRSQHSRLHQQVELVSAPHNPTLPSRLVPLTLSMAPGRDGQLVKLDSAFDKRQDEGRLVSSSSQMSSK